MANQLTFSHPKRVKKVVAGPPFRKKYMKNMVTAMDEMTYGI